MDAGTRLYSPRHPVTRSLDVLADGTPLQVGYARFVAGRVELDIGHADLELDGP